MDCYSYCCQIVFVILFLSCISTEATEADRLTNSSEPLVRQTFILPHFLEKWLSEFYCTFFSDRRKFHLANSARPSVHRYRPRWEPCLFWTILQRHDPGDRRSWQFHHPSLRRRPNGLALTWSIPDTSLQTFSINPTTGDIFTTVNITTLNVTRSFHRQARSVLEFLVRATNSAGQTCDSLVRINILTATKPQVTIAIFNGSASGSATATAAPTWTLARYSFTTRVCKSGSIVASITANNGPTSYAILGNSDYDIDNNGNIKISSSVSPGAQTFVVGATNNLGTAYTLVTIRTKSCPAGIGSANVNLAGAPVFSQEAYR